MVLNIGLAFFILIFPFSPKIPINIFGNLILIRIGDLIVPVLFLIWLIELLLKKRQFVYSGLYIPIGVYFLVGLISTLVGYYIKHTVGNPLYAACVILRSAEYYIIFFLTVNILKTKRQLTHYLNLFLVAAILIAIYGIFDQALNISGPTGLYDKGWFYLQSNHMGCYLMIVLMLAIGLFSVAANKTQKILPIIAILLASYVLFFNLSRITYLSTFAAIIVYCILRSRRLIWVTVFLAFFIFWFIPKMMPQALVGRYLNSAITHTLSLNTIPQSTGDSIASDFSAAQHRDLIKRAFKTAYRYPFIGEGQGAHELEYYDSQLALVPASTGIIGSLAFIWLLLAIARNAMRTYRKVRNTQFFNELIRIYLSIFVGVLVHSIASVAFVIAAIAYPFWFLTGVIVSIPRLSQPQNN